MGVAERKSRRRVGGSDRLVAEPGHGLTGLGDFEHSGYTIEGHIERVGAFYAGLSRRKRGLGRFMLLSVVVLVLAVPAIALLNALLS